MTSFMLASSSSIVSPSLIAAGNSKHRPEKPPSGALITWTVNFLVLIFSIFFTPFAYLLFVGLHQYSMRFEASLMHVCILLMSQALCFLQIQETLGRIWHLRLLHICRFCLPNGSPCSSRTCLQLLPLCKLGCCCLLHYDTGAEDSFVHQTTFQSWVYFSMNLPYLLSLTLSTCFWFEKFE